MRQQKTERARKSQKETKRVREPERNEKKNPKQERTKAKLMKESIGNQSLFTRRVINIMRATSN